MSDVNGINSKKRETTPNGPGARRTEVSESVTDVLGKQLQQHQMHRLQRESYQQQHHLPSLRIDTALARARVGTDGNLQTQNMSNTSSVKTGGTSSTVRSNHPPGNAPRLEDPNSLASLISPLSIQAPSILSSVLTGAQTLDTDITQNKVPFPTGNTTSTTSGSGSGNYTSTRSKPSVSFQLPRGNAPVRHRHSISCVPLALRDGQHRKRLTVEDIVKAMRSKESGPEGKSHQDTDLQEALDDHDDDSEELEVEEKSCSVHMPGDFVYLSKENEEAVSDTSTRLSTPALEVASVPSASVSRSVSPFFPSSSTSLERGRTCSAPVAYPTSTLLRDKKVIFRKHALTTTTTTIPTSTDPQIPFTEYFQEEDDNKIHILLGATGSVASIKIPLIIDRLLKIYTPDRVSIQLIVTKAAENFLDNLRISSLVKVWRDEDSMSVMDGESLLFRELRLWADIFLIAPLSANTLAKLANGMCDNLLTSVFRDWTDTATAPVLIAPAMNTFMYINPMTKKHLKILKESFAFIEVLRPVEKVLVCGDIGMGGMREWVDIVEIVRHRIKEILRNRHESASDKEDREDANDELLLNTPPSAEGEEEEEEGEEEEEEEDNNDSDSGGEEEEDEDVRRRR